MPSYYLFTCPACEYYFRVLWPRPLPAHLHRDSKIRIACPDCHEVNEPYAFLLAIVRSAPNPSMSTVQPLAISERDPNPDPDASLKWQQQKFMRRAARFREMYGN